MLFAFAFGLVHGFGFASVLVALDLPRQARSLAAFNFGVEIGQVIIVLVAAPLIAALNIYARPRLARGLLSAAACAVVLVGSYWLWQRAFSA